MGGSADGEGSGGFGRLLRRYRTHARLTQEELAQRAGVSVRSISAMERGRVRYPRAHSVALLAGALGLGGAELAAFERLARELFWLAAARPEAGEGSQPAGGAQLDALPAPAPAAAAASERPGVLPGPLAGPRPHPSPARPDPVRLPPPGFDRPYLPVPAQLPPDVSAFTGRDPVLAWLDELVPAADAVGAGGGATPVAVVTGPPGVGKSALAVHWARRVRARFPDGQLYVNLRGFARDSPLRPDEALARMLPALGVPRARVPHDVDEAGALYRSLLADRRVLVVLDDARNAEQVRPLLPGGAGCLVLVTSRDALEGLAIRDGAHRLPLPLLTVTEVDALLRRVVGAEPVEAEPAAAAELGALCGYLPLALRIAAANLRRRPGMSLRRYAAELRSGNRLNSLEVVGDEAIGLRAAFSLSYAALPEPDRRLFRLLGLLPADVRSEAAAALAGVPLPQVAPLLARLANAHLVEWQRPDRVTLHELPRLYAAEQVRRDAVEDTTAALGRLYDHYLRSVQAAAPTLHPDLPPPDLPPPGPPLPDLPPRGADGEGALPHRLGAADDRSAGWVDADRRNLVHAAVDAAGRGMHEVAWRLAYGLTGYFRMRPHLDDWQTVADAGLAAARACGDPLGTAAVLLCLSQLHSHQNRYAEAVRTAAGAGEYAAAAGWNAGEVAAVAMLGNAYRNAGDPAAAQPCLLEAAGRSRTAGLVGVQARSLANLGMLCHEQGRLTEAVRHYQGALDLSRSLDAGSRHSANILVSLGDARRALGHLRPAHRHLARALVLLRKLGDQGGEAYTLRCLAEVHRDLGQHRTGARLAAVALELARSIGDRRVEAQAAETAASIRGRTGAHAIAVADHQRALDLAEEVGNRYTMVEALLGLAVCRARLGDIGPAEDAAVEGLTLARAGGYRLLTGQALTAVAAIRLAGGRVGAAHRDAALAASEHAAIDYPVGEADALWVLAEAAARGDDLPAASQHRQRARELLVGTDLPRAGSVHTLLDRRPEDRTA